MRVCACMLKLAVNQAMHLLPWLFWDRVSRCPKSCQLDKAGIPVSLRDPPDSTVPLSQAHTTTLGFDRFGQTNPGPHTYPAALYRLRHNSASWHSLLTRTSQSYGSSFSVDHWRHRWYWHILTGTPTLSVSWDLSARFCTIKALSFSLQTHILEIQNFVTMCT